MKQRDKGFKFMRYMRLCGENDFNKDTITFLIKIKRHEVNLGIACNLTLFFTKPGLFSYLKSATVGTNCTIQYYYKLVKQPNDGLLNKDVQTAIPGIKDDYIIQAKSINHEQMKHHKDVAKILDDIFNGGKGDKFYIK